MSQECIKKENDGYYHPKDEAEIICLVKKAADEGLNIRCRGAAHSVAWSIYTNPVDHRPKNKVSVERPPDSKDINIIFNRMRKLEWIDEKEGIVEAEAGINLGVDPDDPTGTSTLANGLLLQIWEKGFALDDLGGITHQTISGFLTTGSAGGSLTYDLSPNIIGFRVIDGNGEAAWIEKDDEIFGAMALSLGLLGVITKVRLKLSPYYNIYGQEFTFPTKLESCPIDLFGPGTDTKPSMKEYMEKTPYTRMLWWPQKGVNRVVTWEAVRGPVLPAFVPAPHKEFADIPFLTKLEQLGAALLFTMLGNKRFITIWAKLHHDYWRFRNLIKDLWQKKLAAKLGKLLGKIVAWIASTLLTLIIMVITFPFVLVLSIVRPLLRLLLPIVIRVLQPVTKNGKANLFMDHYWRSLPMDNAADDILMGTEFTEIWIPLKYTENVMNLLNNMFKDVGYKATSFYSTEIYAGYKSGSWMSPGYTDGKDEYKDGTIRVDVFWYINNEGGPNAKGGFYQLYWDLFLKHGIPFRLHWGKFVPDYDFEFWAKYYKENLPRFDDFMALRAKRDPKNIFYTDYWKLRLTGKA